jgi:hypothetical protein
MTVGDVIDFATKKVIATSKSENAVAKVSEFKVEEIADIIKQSLFALEEEGYRAGDCLLIVPGDESRSPAIMAMSVRTTNMDMHDTIKAAFKSIVKHMKLNDEF